MLLEWRIAANGRMDLSSLGKQRRWRTRQWIRCRFGPQDKSAEIRRARVVGWVEIFRPSVMSSAGAFLGNAKEINMRRAISDF